MGDQVNNGCHSASYVANMQSRFSLKYTKLDTKMELQIQLQIYQNGPAVNDDILLGGDERPVDTYVPLTITILTAFSSMLTWASIVAENFIITVRCTFRSTVDAELRAKTSPTQDRVQFVVDKCVTTIQSFSKDVTENLRRQPPMPSYPQPGFNPCAQPGFSPLLQQGFTPCYE